MKYIEQEDLKKDTVYFCETYDGDCDEFLHIKDGEFEGGFSLYGDIRFAFVEVINPDDYKRLKLALKKVDQNLVYDEHVLHEAVSYSIKPVRDLI